MLLNVLSYSPICLSMQMTLFFPRITLVLLISRSSRSVASFCSFYILLFFAGHTYCLIPFSALHCPHCLSLRFCFWYFGHCFDLSASDLSVDFVLYGNSCICLVSCPFNFLSFELFQSFNHHFYTRNFFPLLISMSTRLPPFRVFLLLFQRNRLCYEICFVPV